MSREHKEHKKNKKKAYGTPPPPSSCPAHLARPLRRRARPPSLSLVPSARSAPPPRSRERVRLTPPTETFRRTKDEVAPVLDQCLGWLERNGTVVPLSDVLCGPLPAAGAFPSVHPHSAAAIDAEGLFRVSGAVREVDDLLKQFEKCTAPARPPAPRR